MMKLNLKSIDQTKMTLLWYNFEEALKKQFGSEWSSKKYASHQWNQETTEAKEAYLRETP